MEMKVQNTRPAAAAVDAAATLDPAGTNANVALGGTAALRAVGPWFVVEVPRLLKWGHEHRHS